MDQSHKLSFNLLCGFICLFLFTGSVYAQKEYKILPTDGALSDQFGNAVSISENRAIVGALQNDEKQVNGGAAYIYTYDDITDAWVEETKLLAEDGGLYDEFGTSVAMSGNKVAIGAPNHAGMGAVYIFERNDTAWSQVGKVISRDIAAGDYFGSTLAMSGDRILIGAKGDNSIYGFDQGAAYVFAFDDTLNQWREEAKLIPAASGMIFGFSTSLDISETHAIIGSTFDRTNGNNNSSVYIFALGEDGWVEETRLVGSRTRLGDNYGSSVAIDGNIALVGAYLHDANAQDNGSTFAYSYETDTTGSQWVEQGRLETGDSTIRAFFGKTIALSGNQALIAATGFDKPNEAAPIADAGAVYLFTHDEVNGWTLGQTYSAEEGLAYDQLGASLAMDGRYSIMGAVGRDDNGSNSGAAYILVQPDGLEIEISGDQTVYLGYEPTSCATLTVEGAPEGSTILWNTGDTTETIIACPDTADGSVTYSVLVIDAEGNSATAEIDVCIVDISCGEGKVSMCIRSAITGQYQTLCVSTFWVQTYLNYTGFDARLGGCDLDLCTPKAEEDTTQQNRIGRETVEVMVDAMPNPFVDQVTILFQLPESTHATLEVYDLAGKKIAELYDGAVEAGRTYEQKWKASHMIPGLYIYRLHTDKEVITRKIVLAR